MLSSVPSQGGLKAVIWTDVFMSVVIISTCLLVIFSGSSEVGGVAKAWRVNQDAGRMDIFT